MYSTNSTPSKMKSIGMVSFLEEDSVCRMDSFIRLLRWSKENGGILRKNMIALVEYLLQLKFVKRYAAKG